MNSRPRRRWSTCCCSQATRSRPCWAATRALVPTPSTPPSCWSTSARWFRAKPRWPSLPHPSRRLRNLPRWPHLPSPPQRTPRRPKASAPSSCAWARWTTPRRPTTCWTCSPSTWRASRWPSWPSVARPSQLGTRLTASSMHRTQAKPPPLKRATASSTTPRAGLTDLDRTTRDLQEAVMSIRMIPMSTVFSRFPRMLRDLANKLGKKVELVTQGEATELDKGPVEKITDPLTHLVRNSCDHGVEMPADRLAKGKPEVGTITLAASHQGGSIVIEVRDDGRGLNRDKLIKKAREKGIDAPDTMTDPEVWNLIFAPGFSTADEVTDVSGRGVGMDVVKKNITSLGGTVEIDSAEGYGMRVAVRLPLTLAIMDGMSVGVGEEVYILPLSSVVESFQVNQEGIKTVGGSGLVVEVRDEYMPVIELEKVFQVPRFDWEHSSGIMVVVEAEGGRVALLLDVGSLVRRSRH